MSSETLSVISDVVGWIYFVAWSVSFYGQLYTNWRLKSVEGYKLDFQVLNLTGFSFYSYIYVMGYFYPDDSTGNYGLGTVQIQDLLFALHALVIVCCTGIQCFIYPRGSNKVTKIVWCLVVFYWTTAVIFYVLFQVTNTISSTKDFNFIIYLGYYKLSISVIKYVPPAYWNFKRRSTVGWSIQNVLLDFTGGFFSIAQTIIEVVNGDSDSINPIKFALGNISMLFDILFSVQHFCLFKDKKKRNIISDSIPEEDMYESLKPNTKKYNGSEYRNFRNQA